METAYIGWYNLENVYEPANHPRFDDEWSEERYAKKIANLAEVIDSLHGEHTIDLLGVCEVETDKVMRDILEALGWTDTHAIIHHSSTDIRQIDIGIFYKTEKLSVVDVTAHNVQKRYPTRDILSATVSIGDQTELVVMCNHWPSRTGGRYETEPYRIMLGENCSWLVHQEYLDDLDVNILVMGDFNDEPYDRAIHEYLYAIQNRARVMRYRGSTHSRPYLYNPTSDLLQGDRGTFYYSRSPAGWNMVDQMMISKGLLRGPGLTFQEASLDIFDPDWIRQGIQPKPFRIQGGEWVTGYSDHFPITARLELPD